ncbi:DNA-binding protein [Candidatus Woesearchaeota archaeon]|nr:DNA-binding protein [Candidatus Woesearchaeota archaeon]
MPVKDLKARQGNVNLVLDIAEKGDIREFEKFGNKGRVCNAKGRDETGEIKITLWNEDVEAVKEGDKIRIDNGWVSEWQGELQLSTGKSGKITVLESSKKAAEKEEEPLPPEEASHDEEEIGEEDIGEDEK